MKDTDVRIFVLIVSNPDQDSHLNPSLYCSGANANLVIVEQCKQTSCQLRGRLAQWSLRSIGRQHILRHRLLTSQQVFHRPVRSVHVSRALFHIRGGVICCPCNGTRTTVLTYLPLECQSAGLPCCRSQFHGSVWAACGST